MMKWRNFFKRKPNTIKYVSTDLQASVITEGESVQKLIDLRLMLTKYMETIRKSKEITPQGRAEFDLCQTILRKMQ